MSEQFCVFLKLKPGTEEAFIAASRVNQANARKEAGNLRFDIYRSTENTSHFLFSEEYDTEASVLFHRETPHFLTWLETITPMLEEPRQRVPGSAIPPEYHLI